MQRRVTSQKGIDLLKSFEGFRDVAYQDIGGVWTIGYGTTKNVHPGMKVTAAEAEGLLRQDVKATEDAINSMVHVEISQNEFDALVCFAYNVGCGNLQKSTLLRLLNAGDPAAASAEFLKWDKVAGKEVAGLLRRRQAEAELFCLPD